LRFILLKKKHCKKKVSVFVFVFVIFLYLRSRFLVTMKKILFLLTMLFAHMAAEAQIQRNFFGLELGVSTRQQAMEHSSCASGFQEVIAPMTP